MKCLLILLLLAGAVAAPLVAQPLFEHGDVIVSTFAATGHFSFVSRLLVYSRDGSVRELGSSVSNSYRETLVLDGVLHVARRSGIERIDSGGQILTPFSNIFNTVYMSPSLDDSIVASNGSGQVYRLKPDGSVRIFRDTVGFNDPRAGGIDLASDQCTAFYLTATRLASWDSCRNTKPILFGSEGPRPGGFALRLLSDGSFIAAFLSDIIQYDSSGQIMRR